MINKKLLVITLLFSIATAALTYLYLEKIKSDLDTTEYVEVIVASVSIPPDTLIGRESLTTKKIPVEYAHPNSIYKFDAVVGKVARGPLTKGEAILQTHLIDQKSTEEGLAYSITPGMRAVTLGINRISAASYLILPGDWVDILVTMDIIREVGGRREQATQTNYVLENVEVLAVGTQMRRNVSEQGKEQQTIILQVAPEDAPKLILASEVGSIKLLLRSPRDDKQVGLLSATLEDITGK